MKVRVIDKERTRNVYGELYGEKGKKKEDFFLGIFVLNNKSLIEFACIAVYTMLQFGSYFYITLMLGTKLNFTQLAIFLLTGIVNLYFITHFIAHYIVMPRIETKVEEKLTANWADAIRYSRYPATMILAVFGIFVYICWLIVASDLKHYLTRFPIILMIGPLICSIAGYSACAFYTFRGTSPIYTDAHKHNASIHASAFWMTAEFFLVLSMVDIIVLAVYIFNYLVVA